MLLLGHWLPLRGSALRPGLCCMWGVCGVCGECVGCVWGLCEVCVVCVGCVWDLCEVCGLRGVCVGYVGVFVGFMWGV